MDPSEVNVFPLASCTFTVYEVKLVAAVAEPGGCVVNASFAAAAGVGVTIVVQAETPAMVRLM